MSYFRGDTAKGYQQITDVTSAQTISINDGTNFFLIEPEFGNVRIRDDGTAPTETSGLVIKEGFILEYTASNKAVQVINDTLPIDPSWGIVSNFDVQNSTAIKYKVGGFDVTLSANTTCDTGTSKTIAADQWAAMLITGDMNNVLTGTWTADAASEAAAITALKALTTPSAAAIPLGYITVQTASSQTWTAGTDALQGGTGGNPSADTNYYNYRGVRVNVIAYGTN